MNRSLTLALACCMSALLSACGSSSKGTGTTSGKAGASATTTSAAGDSSTAASSTGGSEASKSKSTTEPNARLGLDTTPKFASPSSSAPVQSGVVQIAYRNIAIDPDTVRVKLGSTIKWTNYDSAEANVTSEGGPLKFASKNFGEGGTFELKASKAGVIHYECTLYPVTMNGTIEVVS
jgi:plastocyanin